MSVSLIEVIEAAGYDLTTLEDATWLLSKQNEFDTLIAEAEALRDAAEDAETAESERLYGEWLAS